MPNTQKRLLVLGASQDQAFMVKTAKAMGIATLAVDMNPDAPALALADDYGIVSTRDIPALKAFLDDFIKAKPIHGVATMGSDIPHIVAEVAEHLGTWHIAHETAKLATNKYEMKEAFKRGGVRIPDYRLVGSAHEVHAAFDQYGKLVIKPLSEAGSRGVSLITNKADIDELFARAFAYAVDGKVLIESFLEGPQISTESLMVDGKIVTPGYADRNYDVLERFLPQIMENGGIQPSQHQDAFDSIEAMLLKAAKSLGLHHGVMKGDVVLTKDGPAIIEVAARLSGGDFCESLVPLGTGVNYVRNVIRMALGEAVDLGELTPTMNRAVSNRYFFAEPGRFHSVEGVDEVTAKDWIHKFEIWYKPGDILPETRSHGQRFGVFVLTADDRETAIEREKWVYDTIKIRIDPL